MNTKYADFNNTLINYEMYLVGGFHNMKYESGFIGSATEPPEEGCYWGKCNTCLMVVLIPEGECHDRK